MYKRQPINENKAKLAAYCVNDKNFHDSATPVSYTHLDVYKRQAHDSHNLIVAGTNDADMVLAGNTVRKNKGGLAFALNGQVVGELPLPVAGLMSTESAESVEEKLQALKAALKAHGISEDIDAFMTLAFVSLPVIPKLRLNTYGIVDVDAQRIVPAVF